MTRIVPVNVRCGVTPKSQVPAPVLRISSTPSSRGSA